MKEHNLEAFYKYYSNATKEQAIEDMYLDNCKQGEEIERLNNIINNGKNKVQEVKEHLDKSGFDGMTKSILIMALNEIIYSLNGDGSNEQKNN